MLDNEFKGFLIIIAFSLLLTFGSIVYFTLQLEDFEYPLIDLCLSEEIYDEEAITKNCIHEVPTI